MTDTSPNFCLFGFHTARHVWVRRANGDERRAIYWGYGIFGPHPGFTDATHWKAE